MIFGLFKKKKMETGRTGRPPRRIIKGTGPKNRPPRLWPPEDKLSSGHLKTNVETAQPSDEDSSILGQSTVAEESPEPPKTRQTYGGTPRVAPPPDNPNHPKPPGPPPKPSAK